MTTSKIEIEKAKAFIRAKPAASLDQQIFQQANAYLLGATRCAQPEENSKGGVLVASLPMITCLSFASALYMKSLLVSRGPVKSHDLDLLYKRLSSNERTEVSTLYSTATGRAREQCSGDVKKLASCFVDWRYLYEQSNLELNVNNLVGFTRALFLFIRQIRSDWAIENLLEQKLRSPFPENVLIMIYLGGGKTIRGLIPQVI